MAATNVEINILPKPDEQLTQKNAVGLDVKHSVATNEIIINLDQYKTENIDAELLAENKRLGKIVDAMKAAKT